MRSQNLSRRDTMLSIVDMRLSIQRAFRNTGRRKGQALTEFALTVPVMVTALLFAIFFYEINHLKMKTQEMSRYAAWEFTGYPLHDYAESKQSSMYDTAEGSVKGDFDQRFANLESTNTMGGSKYITVSWRAPTLQLKNEIEPKIPSGRELGLPINLNTVFNLVTTVIDVLAMLRFKDPNPVLELMMGFHKIEENLVFGASMNRFNPPKRWGFNDKGYVHSKVRLIYRNEFIPRRFMNKKGGMYDTSMGHNEHFMASRLRFEENAAVVADSWRLHYGDSIDHDSGNDKAYWKAVDRMAWVSKSVRNVVMKTLISMPTRLLVGLISVAAGGTGYIAVPPDMDPMKIALVSKAYKDQNPASGQVRLNEDSGSHSYDTSPNAEDSDYRGTFDKRGENFMGCPEPESMTCGPSLSTDNPFGDFIVPPAE